MQQIPLTDPAAMDRLLAEGNLFALLEDFKPDTPLGKARRAQLAYASADHALMTEALAQLQDIPGPLTRGLTMLLQSALGDYAAVLQVSPQPLGGLPLDLEDATNAHAAAAIAHVQSMNYEQGSSCLSVAIALGQAAGMMNRVSIMEIERERLHSLAGTARPDELQRLLLAPMSDRRRAWGRRTWAEALMSLGDYQTALRILGHPSIDQPSDAALRAFLHALLRLPPVKLDDTAEQCAYGRLAALVHNPSQITELKSIEGEPQATYLALIGSLLLARTPETMAQAVRMAGPAFPKRQDQALLYSLIWLAAAAQGFTHPQPGQLRTALLEAPLRLRTTQHVVGLVTTLLPEVTMLLHLGNFMPEINARALGLPLLLGSELLVGGQRHRVPRTAGRVLVCIAAGVPEEEPHREQKRRLAIKLQELGYPDPVNMGRVLSMARGLAQAVTNPEDAHIWNDIADKVQQMLTPDVRDVLAMYP